MARIKLTKTEWKKQKDILKRLERYLPLLQMRKQQLQQEVDQVRRQRSKVLEDWNQWEAAHDDWIPLLAEEVDLEEGLKVESIDVRWENVAGVNVPASAEVHCLPPTHDLYLTPLWVDQAVKAIQEAIGLAARDAVLEEAERRLARELRVTSQRVNLFEQVRLPEARENIRTISIFLSDQQTAAFGWALIAKRKIQNREAEEVSS